MAAVVVADTSAWIPHLTLRENPRMRLALDQVRLVLPPVVAAELLSGRLDEAKRAGLVAILADVPWFAADREHWFRVGGLRALLRGRGVQVSLTDAHVAQCALDLDAELLTEDGDFRRIAKHTRLRLVSDG